MESKNISDLGPVDHAAVTFTGGFWEERTRINREVTIPAIYEKLKQTGGLNAFDPQTDFVNSSGMITNETDVCKWLEAAAYSLASHPDSALKSQCDKVVDLIVGAQQPDGYLNCYLAVGDDGKMTRHGAKTNYKRFLEPEQRWTNLNLSHELYTAGHLMEAAVAYFDATGKKKLLDSACRFTDLIDTLFGREEGKTRGYDGHPEIELALMRLYHATTVCYIGREERYLNLCRYFIDERGREPNYFDLLKASLPPGTHGHWDNPLWEHNALNQAHEPLAEQKVARGHAVCAMYIYCGMIDLAMETGDTALGNACLSIWDSIFRARHYVIGAIGNAWHNEGFTVDYDLPNEGAYNETCANVAFVFWNHRMLQFDFNSRYADMIERSLYNGVISGVSLGGDKFFYQNLLASSGKHNRWEWHPCACCPPNLARLLASVGNYFYSCGDGGIAIHQYGANEATMPGCDGLFKIRQETEYPWDGKISITLEFEEPFAFALKLRKPGWCSDYSVTINGEAATPNMDRGYLSLERTWRSGDRVELTLAMPAVRVYADPRVRGNRGRVALQRGPIVYCLEQADNGANLDMLSLPRSSAIHASPDKIFGMGAICLQADAVRELPFEHDELYRNQPPGTQTETITAVPYFCWDNRTPGEMAVWIREG